MLKIISETGIPTTTERIIGGLVVFHPFILATILGTVKSLFYSQH